MKIIVPLRLSDLILMIAVGAVTLACRGTRGTLEGEQADAEQADRARHHYDRPAYLLFTGEGEPAGRTSAAIRSRAARVRRLPADGS